MNPPSQNALGGIKNLKITYGEDASIIASFEVLDDTYQQDV